MVYLVILDYDLHMIHHNKKLKMYLNNKNILEHSCISGHNDRY